MNNSLLNYIGRIYIELSREIEHKEEYIDLGGIYLEHDGRTFYLDVDNYTILGTVIECRMVYDIAELKETFEDSKFDLTKEDLLSKDLKAEIYITGENYLGKELVRVNSIKLSIENMDRPQHIDLCLDGTVEEYRLHKHLHDFGFEIEEDEGVAQVFTDLDCEEDAVKFEESYEDKELVHCDIALDEHDITAKVYMELSELIKLDESEALRIIRKAA
jgi:hypothetical protein